MNQYEKDYIYIISNSVDFSGVDCAISMHNKKICR